MGERRESEEEEEKEFSIRERRAGREIEDDYCYYASEKEVIYVTPVSSRMARCAKWRAKEEDIFRERCVKEPK